MSVDELFRFKENENGYVVAKYVQKDNTEITEIEISAEYCGKPVVEIRSNAFINASTLQSVTVSEGVQRIGETAFAGCIRLISISLPASLEAIGSGAFYKCETLREVEFRSYPKFGATVFGFDYDLPAETALMGAVCSRDITLPLDNTLLRDEIERADNIPDYAPWFSRPDVFALAAQNDCFREINEKVLYELIEYSVKQNTPEITAYFLDLKNRKFGFDHKSEINL